MGVFEQGGLVLVAIFGVSLVTWYLIVAKWLFLARQRGPAREAWLADVLRRASAGDPDGVLAVLRRKDGTTARMMRALLARHRTGRPLTHRHRVRIAEVERALLRRHVPFITAAAASLPLLGLLGTVLGMMTTFQALTLRGSAEAGPLMAGGIRQALVTTQAGLMTALAVVFCLGLLLSRERRLLDEGTLAIRRLETALRHGGGNA